MYNKNKSHKQYALIAERKAKVTKPHNHPLAVRWFIISHGCQVPTILRHEFEGTTEIVDNNIIGCGRDTMQQVYHQHYLQDNNQI